MKKTLLPSKINDLVLTGEYHVKPRVRPPANKPRRSSALASERKRVCYIPGKAPLEEPDKIPRLFIQGHIGGSVKMDLRGLNIDLSEQAFAHWVTDDNLSHCGINRGDIAIINPVRDTLKNGGFVLVMVDHREVLRRLAKRKSVWFLETSEQRHAESVPLLDQPLYGAVTGILRLFTPVAPVAHRGTNANFRSRKEMSGSLKPESIRSTKKRTTTGHRKVKYSEADKKTFLLAGETPHRC